LNFRQTKEYFLNILFNPIVKNLPGEWRRLLEAILNIFYENGKNILHVQGLSGKSK
jgi:hypothetical protein